MQHHLTFAELIDEAEHAIAGVPNERTTTERIVNGAIEYLCQIHQWNWREAISTLPLVAGEGRIPLPDDLGEIVSLIGFQSRGVCAKTSARNVMAARVGAIGGNFGLYYFLGMMPQATPADVPGRCLEIAPVPATSQADALYLTYRRLIPQLVNPTDVPAIPYGMFEMLRVLVRAMAVSTEDQKAGHDWELFRAMLPNYIHADSVAGGAVQGQMRNVLDDFYAEGCGVSPHDQIQFPGDL